VPFSTLRSLSGRCSLFFVSPKAPNFYNPLRCCSFSPQKFDNSPLSLCRPPGKAAYIRRFLRSVFPVIFAEPHFSFPLLESLEPAAALVRFVLCVPNFMVVPLFVVSPAIDRISQFPPPLHHVANSGTNSRGYSRFFFSLFRVG